MSRTYRRRGERYEYSWVLRDWAFDEGHPKPFLIGVPYWFRRFFKRRQRTSNMREMRRWLADPGYDPVINVRHRNSAQWAWW